MFWVRLPPRCRNFSGTVSHERTISNDFIRHIRQWMESFMALADGKPVCMMLTEAICSWILLIYNNTKKYWLLERWLSSHILHYVKATSLFTKPPFSSQNHLSLHKATSLFTKPHMSFTAPRTREDWIRRPPVWTTLLECCLAEGYFPLHYSFKIIWYSAGIKNSTMRINLPMHLIRCNKRKSHILKWAPDE